jgi:hypothetical protein
MANTAHIYWSYFDPGFLFVQGGNARNLSTGDTGVFLLPVAAFAVAGAFHLRGNRLAAPIILAGLLVTPLPATIKGAPFAIQRVSTLLIYVSLLAGAGVASMLTAQRAAARIAACLLIALTLWQFSSFYREYQTVYRVRSASAYDPTAFGEAARLLVQADRITPLTEVWLPAGYYDAGAKWRFYTQKLDRQDLWHRTQYFKDADTLRAAAPGGFALWPDVMSNVPGGWEIVAEVRNLAGERAGVVIRRLG